MFIDDNFAALAGFDYTSVSSAETFISASTNNAVRCISVSIVDDNALEADQTFTVTLSTPDMSVVLGTTATVVTIRDNDGLYRSVFDRTCKMKMYLQL